MRVAVTKTSHSHVQRRALTLSPQTTPFVKQISGVLVRLTTYSLPKLSLTYNNNKIFDLAAGVFFYFYAYSLI